jgi:hypothetical protein
MGRARTRRWFAVPLVAIATALAWTATGLAVTNVPAITHLGASPNRFCAKKTDRCKHPGTTIRFTLSTAAKVRGDIRPRHQNVGAFVEFVKQFPKGKNTVRLSDRRLTGGRWTLRLQGTNSVGTGNISLLNVQVVKDG